MGRRSVALGLLATLVVGLTLAGIAACAGDGAAAGEPSADSGPSEDGAPADSGAPDEDGATPDAGVARDASGPGAVGEVCSVNRDCQLALRCACDEVKGCACAAGARGTGRSGLDPCTTGDTCASALCIEGPPDAGSFCSDECVTSADCRGQLPLCATIALVGRVCVRSPPP
jgi:hypothetical protein